MMSCSPEVRQECFHVPGVNLKEVERRNLKTLPSPFISGVFITSKIITVRFSVFIAGAVIEEDTVRSGQV